MDERWLQLLLRQHASGFDDLRGAEVALTVPVSERLLNEAIGEGLTLGAGGLAVLYVLAIPAFTDFDRTDAPAIFAWGPRALWISTNRGATWKAVRGPRRIVLPRL